MKPAIPAGPPFLHFCSSICTTTPVKSSAGGGEASLRPLDGSFKYSITNLVNLHAGCSTLMSSSQRLQLDFQANGPYAQTFASTLVTEVLGSLGHSWQRYLGPTGGAELGQFYLSPPTVLMQLRSGTPMGRSLAFEVSREDRFASVVVSVFGCAIVMGCGSLRLAGVCPKIPF